MEAGTRAYLIEAMRVLFETEGMRVAV
jgi:hypothetical protein